MHINYSDECQIGDLTYAVQADSDEDGLVRLRLCGIDSEGVLTAEGTMLVPTSALVDAGNVIRHTLTGLGQLGPVRPRGRLNPSGPTNSYQPWTKDQDEQLLAAWLVEPETAAATTVIGVQARMHGRSRNSIRARLARVGCDPDVPGRMLGGELPDEPGAPAVLDLEDLELGGLAFTSTKPEDMNPRGTAQDNG
ncbi:hypothetical protein [Fodinicola feengrottensis]|uniref:Uncharacterized protein n=1 Tax=Fodinicola feengrottensis TaxID=435914 RepID=A0ABN2GVZ7_9ACTN|nr:hypothetical protein [Fodinicola feengrottensis]